MSGRVKREEAEVIEIPDDDATQSESDPETAAPSRTALGKRRADPAPEVKPEVKDEEKDNGLWTDESEGDYERLKKRKRRSTKGPKAPKKRGRPSRKQDPDDESIGADPIENANLPDYLVDRRRHFDQTRETLREAGLLLPPNYSDIRFHEDARINELEERPQFDERSGVKPCRPYEDVELEYSAGLIPASIAQYLREYQILGVKFLHRLFVYQKGGILGDDMGLGKTVQVAAFLTAAFGKTGDERDRKRMRRIRDEPGRWYPRILIVCPGSLIQNWRNELDRWGWWHTDVFHGPSKDDVLDSARAGLTEVMITTYTTYKNHRSRINMVKWDAVIADECHVLKERASETTKAMNDVNALCRIGLTGTAIQNKYEELWTLLNWTNPGYFGTLAEWQKCVSRPLTVGQSHDATLFQLSLARKTARKLVTNLLPGFFLRRMKTLIAHQLPKKTDRVVFCPLTDLQRDAYQNFLDGDMVQLLLAVTDECTCGSGKKKGWCCFTHVNNGRSWQEVVFPCVITLQKIANHLTLLVPASADLQEKQQSELKTLQMCVPDTWTDLYAHRESMVSLANPEFCGKWKVLKRLLKFWHENGDKVLVFSHSVRLLRILQYLFHNTSYDLSYLDGSLGYEERQAVVDNFNSDPKKFVFLISTKAGGVGLNITSANKVVIVDPHWNPSYDLQAQDRAYRIGQTRDVDVFRLISAGTIDEIVYARQIYKQQQANIGYNASSERRYFKGVQKDPERQGEIFGLANLLSFHDDQLLLRDIVNKTNIAEAKAGVNLVTLDMERAAKEEDLGLPKQEEAEADDGGMSQLAALLTAEDQHAFLDSKKAPRPKSDAVQGILAAAGVHYTHENSEVVGSSRVEEQLSRRAEQAADSDSNLEGDSALFADSQANDLAGEVGPGGVAHVYNPPDEVKRRQFCSMAREFGFDGVVDFALVVESMTQEQRRNCLDTFYKRRDALLRNGGRDVEREVGDDTSMMVYDTPENAAERKATVALDPSRADAGFASAQDVEMELDGAKSEDREMATVKVEARKGSAVTAGRRTSSIFLLDDDDDDDEL